MNFNTFQKTAIGKQMRYQRCLYMISPIPDVSLGLDAPKWKKIGIASTDLYNRMKTYRTYWPRGINVHMIATVKQPLDSEICQIKNVEKHLIDSMMLCTNRIRCTESFRDLSQGKMDWIVSSLREHPMVTAVWVAPTTSDSFVSIQVV